MPYMATTIAPDGAVCEKGVPAPEQEALLAAGGEPIPPRDARASLVSVTLADNTRAIIGDALRSVVDWVDRVLVVDTGVTDGTLDVARAIAGDKLIVRGFPWCDDFSAAQRRPRRRGRDGRRLADDGVEVGRRTPSRSRRRDDGDRTRARHALAHGQRRRSRKRRDRPASSPFGEGFPFSRQNTPMHKSILCAIAESVARSR